MPTLDLTFLEVYTAVSNYLGLGNPTTDTTDLANIKAIVNRGYRKFLMPVDDSTSVTTGRIRSQPKPYRWSFLRQTTTLSVVSGLDTYDLPIGFNGMIVPLKHTTPQTLNPIEVPLEFIYEKRSETTGNSYPEFYAIKEKDFSPLIGRRREIIFEPCPNGSYTYYYTYRFLPEKLVEDADLFVGPPGSSEAILECCLSVAELQEKDTIGVHAMEADRLTQQLIGDDKLSSQVGNIGGSRSAGRPRRTSVINDSSGNQLIPD